MQTLSAPETATTLRRALGVVLVFMVFLAISVVCRGVTISDWHWLNPDEAELMAQGRAAMRSPVPFTTWTTSTTGPVWVYFLAVLGWIGLPLTIVFAHLLAAILVGIAGALGFVILRRALGGWQSIVVSALWWLPFALVYPAGTRTDFGALNTELLPTVLVLAAATISVPALERRPALFAIVGLFGGLAVGAKYQALPIILALLLVQLLQLRSGRSGWITRISWWLGGAALPFALVGLAMAMSPEVSWALVEQNLNFLGVYAAEVSLGDRLVRTTLLLVTRPHVIAIAAVFAVLTVLSHRRIAGMRLLLLLAGLVAVYGGGMAFPHYLVLLYAAVVLGIALPLGERAAVYVERSRVRASVLSAAAVFAVGLLVIGLVWGKVRFSTAEAVGASLDADSVIRSSALERACPPGSEVLVWGFAADLYVNYSWRNGVAFLNATQLVRVPKNHDSGEAMLAAALADPSMDCVVDAVGATFYWPAEQALLEIYPSLRTPLQEEYRAVPGLIDCDGCTVYVRHR